MDRKGAAAAAYARNLSEEEREVKSAVGRTEKLHVPTRLLKGAPSEAITPGERAFAWELATILDEEHQSAKEDDVVWITVATARLRGPGARDDNVHLHRVLGRLSRIQWTGQDPDGTRYVAQLIAQADIAPAGDTVRLLLPPRAVRLLRAPGTFAELDRAAVYSLTGNARALYGLLQDRFNRPEKLHRLEATWRLDELKGLLGLGGRYPEFRDFQRRVLRPTVAAINATGALMVDAKPVRLGRAVNSVTFALRHKSPTEPDGTKREVYRHRSAKGRDQTSADAPAHPRALLLAVERFLTSADAGERNRWHRRARELGSEAPGHRVEDWSQWVATEVIAAEPRLSRLAGERTC